MNIVIIDCPITKNQAFINNVEKIDDRYVQFQLLGPQGAVLHSIGTPQPNAEPIAKYFDDPAVEASAHMILEATGKCLRLAPDNYRLWHAGGSANNTHMGIEMTEPSCISYDPNNGYKLTIHNRSKALEHVVQTYALAVDLFADLCILYNWDPLKDGVILSHKECYKCGIGSNHGDPEHLWDALGTGYTMNTFRAAVAKRVKEKQAESLEDAITSIATQILNDSQKALKDNDSGTWSKEAREWAIANGIVNGIGNGPDGLPNYAWEAPVTREQMVTMLYRFAKQLVPDLR